MTGADIIPENVVALLPDATRFARRHALATPRPPSLISATMPMLTTSRALQIHMFVSACFTAPFFMLGAPEFASMLTDGKVPAAEIAKNGLLVHLFHVDALKNVFITALCYLAAKFGPAEQRQVCMLMVFLMVALMPLFKIAPIHPDLGLPPPAIAYLTVTVTSHCLALAGI